MQRYPHANSYRKPLSPNSLRLLTRWGILGAIVVILTLLFTMRLLAAEPIFTGDAAADFAGGSALRFADPEGDVPLPAPDFPAEAVSGWEMSAIYLHYDATTDILYVGIDCVVICGDADGNGNPDVTGEILGRPLSEGGLGGEDVAAWGRGESFGLLIDTDNDFDGTDGDFEVVVGVRNQADLSTFAAYPYTGQIGEQLRNTGWGDQALPNSVELHAATSARVPDLEFTIASFSTLPGFGDGLPTEYQIHVAMGSLVDDGIGDDFIPGQQQAIAITAMAVATATATNTLVPTEPPATATPSPTPTATNTLVPTEPPATATPSATPTATNTLIPTEPPATATPSPTATATNTLVPTEPPATPTPSATPTATNTLIPTEPPATPTPSATPTPAATATATVPPPTSVPTTGANLAALGSGEGAALHGKAMLPQFGPVAHAGVPMAALQIPSLGIQTTVQELGWGATTDANGNVISQWDELFYGVGWLQNSAAPGESGNVVMSGHNNIYGAVFRNLWQLERGAEIHIDRNGTEFVYAVEAVSIQPEWNADAEQQALNASYLQQTEDARLTLISCWPPENNTHRVFVTARLVAADASPAEVQRASPQLRFSH